MKYFHTTFFASAALTLLLPPLARADLYDLPSLGKTGHSVTLLAPHLP